MELFIKRFIDLLDEMVPVTMVHTLIELPLGAAMPDNYVKLHARLDLADEGSPFVEIELYPYESNNNIELLYAYTYPQEGIIISEDKFIEKLKIEKHARSEKITPLNEEAAYFYEVFYEEQIEVPKQNGEVDELIHRLVPKIVDWLSLSGYERAKEE